MNKKHKHKEGNSSGDKKKGTFIVKVEYCQNNTWQGKITWAEENKKVNFRSALEMVQLMNDALEQAQKDSERKTQNSVS